MIQNMSDLIRNKKYEPQTHSKFSYHASFEDGNGDTVEFPFRGIADDYLYLFKKASETVTFTDKEFILYECNPRAFCIDRYDNGELWSLLLVINNMYTVMDFTERTIKAFPENISDLIDEILMKEEAKLKGLESNFK